MPTRNRLGNLRNVLYRLKRGYGLKVDIYIDGVDTINLATGVRTVTRTKTTVAKGIVLPPKIERTFVYDIGYLKANSNFTYGGLFETADSVVILDKIDLPKGFKLAAEDKYSVIIRHKRYNVKKVSEVDNLAWQLDLKHVTNQPTLEIHDILVRQRIGFADSAGGTI
jgi:hypothetical protein